MKNQNQIYQVSFILPNQPSEVINYIVSAQNGWSAVNQANKSYCGGRNEIKNFLVKKSEETPMIIMNSGFMYDNNYVMVDTFDGFKRFVRK